MSDRRCNMACTIVACVQICSSELRPVIECRWVRSCMWVGEGIAASAVMVMRNQVSRGRVVMRDEGRNLTTVFGGTARETIRLFWQKADFS